MRLWQLSKRALTVLTLALGLWVGSAYADASSMDRIQLVVEQTNLLKNRLIQAQHDLTDLQHQHDKEASQYTLAGVSKGHLVKAGLDISVSKSNLDSINIELEDSQQTISWLNKNIQEIENQLNAISMFGLKVANNAVANVQQLRADLSYQKELLVMEQNRIAYLQKLQSVISNILLLRKENYNRINELLKSRNLLHLKDEQVKNELAYQQQQSEWLHQVDVLNGRLTKLDPVKSHAVYAELERKIFYANESANFAYTQSLLARYQNQIERMKFSVTHSNAINVLNEVSDQVQILSKQINRLDSTIKSRISILQKHVIYLSDRKDMSTSLRVYIENLSSLKKRYIDTQTKLIDINQGLAKFRGSVDHAIQVELSARQGFPTFGVKMLLDLGKEMLLVPALTFQIIKNLSAHLSAAFKATGFGGWILFALAEAAFIFIFIFLRQRLANLLARPSEWRERLNTKWLSLQWLYRNLLDLALVLNIISIIFFFGVQPQSFMPFAYVALVWVVMWSIMTVARLCLVETTHDATGHDMRLYARLKWMILIGGIITALTVFVHQLPLIYELKTLCDRLFLILLMLVSLLLLRFWHVVPNLILSHIEAQHPYLKKSIGIVGVLVPLLLFGNSIIGLFGYVNLIMTVSWYEGVFLVMLIAYLLLRGLLSDGMEQLSRLTIQYVKNGWLWNEAFLKPIDAVLRISLFLMAWAALFISYGWDQSSPIVERLLGLLHYRLASISNTIITPLNILELLVAISFFYWTAKWTREFVYRALLSRTKDMGIRNSIAILSQYSVVVIGAFICLKVLGINLSALAIVASAFAFGVGLGLRDLFNNFACGFLILLERPLRVGDIVVINGIEGEVASIGGRAVTIRTWDHMDLVVPNTEIFNKPFTNWTARDNIVRCVVPIKIGRHDNPHALRKLIHDVMATHASILKEPEPEVFLKEMSDILMEFELRFFVNIRQVPSRIGVISAVLMAVWDVFAAHGIKPPYPQQEIFLRSELTKIELSPSS